MWYQAPPASHVGCDDRNRAGFGFSLDTALDNAQGHIASGWSAERAESGCFAVSVEKSSRYEEDLVAFNDRIYSSQGVPPPSEIKLATFGGSHSTAFLNAAAAI